MSVCREDFYGFEVREQDLRRNTRERKTHNLKQLWQRSHEILKLAFVGYSNKRIADVMGCTEATVSNTVNSDLGIAKLSEMRALRDGKTIDVAKKVAELLKPALETYKEILDDKEGSLHLRKQVADTVLMDIGGYRAPARSESVNVHATSDEITAMRERGLKAARERGFLKESIPAVAIEVAK